MSNLRGVISLILLAAHTAVWCTPLYLIGIVRLLVRNQRATDFLALLMNRIVEGWVATNRALFGMLGINRTLVTWNLDTPLSRNGWYVVLSNHQGWSDILILQDVLLGKVPPLKFFVKRPLLWVPLIGVAMWFLDFPYVRRYSRDQIAANPDLRVHDQEAVRTACEHFKRAPTSVLNFLEGTRFTPVKHSSQNSHHQHLLLPKVGGIHSVLSAVGDRLAGVVDVTIVYPDVVPSFWDYLCGRNHPPTVEIRSLPAPAFELQRDDVRTWIEQIWAGKDARIDELHGAR